MGCVCAGTAGSAVWVCGAAAGATCVADGGKVCAEPEASAWLLPPPQAVSKTPDHVITESATTVFKLLNIAFHFKNIKISLLSNLIVSAL
jgi:hypothetical protein